MSERARKGNRWKAYQCPKCFGLFRLKASETGRQGHCPTCDSVIKVPAEVVEQTARSVPEPVMPKISLEEERPEGDDQQLLKKVARAKAMTAEEKEVRQKSKRRRNTSADAARSLDMDWEEIGQDKSKFPWVAVSLSLMGAFGAAIFGVIYIQSQRSGAATAVVGEDELAIVESASQLDNLGRYLDEDGNDTAELSVNQMEFFDLDAIEARIEGFLEAKTVEEMKQFVRDPARVGPKMEKFYRGKEIEAPGLRSINRSFATKGKFVMSTKVQTGNFDLFPITVTRVEQKRRPDEYYIDWESWVGYGEYSPTEMKAQKPTEPFLVRVTLLTDDYYNYHFSDDRKWRAYEMSFRGSSEVILGYLDRDRSEYHKQFRSMERADLPEPWTLLVRYPPNARSNDQVEIVAVVSEGWIPDLADNKPGG